MVNPAGQFALVAHLVVQREGARSLVARPKPPAFKPGLETAVGEGCAVNERAEKQQQREKLHGIDSIIRGFGSTIPEGQLAEGAAASRDDARRSGCISAKVQLKSWR